MVTHNIRLDPGHINFDKLVTDEDFRKEARKHLPKMIEKISQTIAEESWDVLQKGFKGSAIKLNNSAGDKRKFVRETANEYKKNMKTKDKNKLEADIILQLRDQKNNSA